MITFPTRLTRRSVLFAGAVSAAGCTSTASGDGAPLAHDFVEQLLTDPRAMRDGAIPYGPSGGLPDNSFEFHQQSASRAGDWLARARIMRARASGPEVETLDVLIWDLERDVALRDYYWHPFPLGYANSQLTLVVGAVEMASTIGEIHCEPAAADIRYAPRFVDNITAKLVGQVERGLTVPAAEAVRALEATRQVAAQLQAIATRAAESEAAPACVSGVRRDLVAMINGPLAAAIARLQSALTDRYLAGVDETSRLALAEDAQDYHAKLIELRTSHRATPAEEYEAARQDLADIDEDLARMRRAMGVGPNAEVFHAGLARDPRWFARDRQDLARRLNAARERITPLVGALFQQLQRAPYGVEPLPDELSTTKLNGTYEAPSAETPRGIYYFNATQLDVTNWMWATPLISHELMPGHHLQLALTEENPTLSDYRKWFGVSGYIEGWGEYARRLMEETELYESDPYGLYASRLIDRRFALRSLVDAGVHGRDWNWRQADALLATDPLTRPGTTRQIALSSASLRGSGLPYWRGLKEFTRLRRMIEQRAGSRFDLPAFNNALLAGGALPFPILERRLRVEA